MRLHQKFSHFRIINLKSEGYFGFTIGGASLPHYFPAISRPSRSSKKIDETPNISQPNDPSPRLPSAQATSTNHHPSLGHQSKLELTTLLGPGTQGPFDPWLHFCHQDRLFLQKPLQQGFQQRYIHQGRDLGTFRLFGCFCQVGFSSLSEHH